MLVATLIYIVEATLIDLIIVKEHVSEYQLQRIRKSIAKEKIFRKCLVPN